MRVFVCKSFAGYASSEARDALIAGFKWWKADASREFESPFFGKDAGLIAPKVGGREYALRHCHLVPIHDVAAKVKWSQAFKRRSRKTSDRILIYAQQGEDFYLINVIDDPGAHQIMRMQDKQGRSFMLDCAQQADVFLSGQLVLEPV